ncbi:MAG TPA: hypothetical protein VEF76_15230, partial [Patescibacteria group bacterium]|nr:hypothetical protein [Patescibacteria group bacterium]
NWLRENNLGDEIKGAADAALFARLLRRAEAGDSDALYATGYMLDSGVGVAADAARATRQYEAAAALGQAEALTLLGSRARQERMDAKALEYFDAAAAKGNARAFFLRGMMRRDSPKPDYAGAYADFLRAAELGNPDALAMLFRAHMRGEGVPADDRAAYIWALRAMRDRDHVLSVGIWSDCEAIAWDLGPAARREAEAEARNWPPKRQR